MKKIMYGGTLLGLSVLLSCNSNHATLTPSTVPAVQAGTVSGSSIEIHIRNDGGLNPSQDDLKARRIVAANDTLTWILRGHRVDPSKTFHVVFTGIDPCVRDDKLVFGGVPLTASCTLKAPLSPDDISYCIVESSMTSCPAARFDTAAFPRRAKPIPPAPPTPVKPCNGCAVMPNPSDQ